MHSVDVFHLPAGPVWVLHSFYLVSTVLMLVWYLRYLGHQISSFGQATARFGVTVANRVDELEAEVADLRERVARLEAMAAGR